MKYERSRSFRADYAHLTEAERELFKDAVRELNQAYERRAGPLLTWPAALRVKRVRGHPSVWELTWSFTGPDGRATFEIIDIGGEPAIRWRRIGGHAIFREP